MSGRKRCRTDAHTTQEEKKLGSARLIDRTKRARDVMIETLKAAAVKDDHSKDADPLDGGLEHLVQVVGVLVTMNKEIWDRCKERVKIVRAHAHFQRKMKEGEPRPNPSSRIQFVACGLETQNIVMQRDAYSIVKVDGAPWREGGRLPTNTRDRTLNNTAFRAIPVRQERVFRLPSLPVVLETFIHAETFGDCFTNYEAFLDRTSCLHDDVLRHFLVLFKRHLEEVQVCLGEIDRWTMYCDECVSELETTFHMELPQLNMVTETDRAFGQNIKFFKSTGSINLTFYLSTGNERAKLKKFVEFSEL